MVKEKGLDPSSADRIGEYVKLKGGLELVEQLCQDTALYKNKSAKAALDDMKLLLQFVELFGIKDKVIKGHSLQHQLLFVPSSLKSTHAFARLWHCS